MILHHVCNFTHCIFGDLRCFVARQFLSKVYAQGLKSACVKKMTNMRYVHYGNIQNFQLCLSFYPHLNISDFRFGSSFMGSVVPLPIGMFDLSLVISFAMRMSGDLVKKTPVTERF